MPSCPKGSELFVEARRSESSECSFPISPELEGVIAMFISVLTIVSAFALGGPVAYPDTACQVLLPEQVPAAGRKSPLDSLTFSVKGRPIKVCYGRPSSRGRVMIGGAEVPYGKLWRTGANEPTILFTPIALDLAGLKVPPG